MRYLLNRAFTELLLIPIVWFFAVALPLVWATPGGSIDYNARLIRLAESRCDAPESEPSGLGDLLLVFIDVGDAITDALDAIEILPAPEQEYPDSWPVRLEFELVWDSLADVTYAVPYSEEDRKYLDRDLSRDFAVCVVEDIESLGLFRRLDNAVRAGRFTPCKGSGLLIYQQALDYYDASKVIEANHARMHLALVRGDEEGYLQALATQLRLAEALWSIPCRSASNAGRFAAAHALRGVLDDVGLLSLSGKAEACCLLEQHRPVQPVDLLIEADRLEMLDLIQAFCTDDGRGDGRVVLSAMFPGGCCQEKFDPPGNVLGALLPTKRQVSSRYNEFMDTCVIASRQGRYARLTTLWDARDIREEFRSWRYILWASALDEVDRELDDRDAMMALLSATRTTLRVEFHRDQYGELPGSLAELDAGSDFVFADDPFAPDGRLRYRRDSGAERGYILYSVGLDEIDDGGIIHPEGFSGFRLAGVGYDEVFCGD